MAKAGIHPDYHTITVTMTDGTTYKTRSTYDKEGATLLLDVDSKTHPAWVGGETKLRQTGRLQKFNDRFSSINTLNAGAVTAAASANKAPSAAKKDDKKKK